MSFAILFALAVLRLSGECAAAETYPPTPMASAYTGTVVVSDCAIATTQDLPAHRVLALAGWLGVSER